MSRQFHMFLEDRQYRLLREESLRTGLAMAELVRRALDATYRPASRKRLHGYEVAVTVTREPDVATVGRVQANVPGRPLYAREM